MIKVNLTNAQIAVQRVINILERGEDRLALAYLTDFKRKAYNKLYRAERKYEETMPTGVEYQVRQAQIKQARIEKEQIYNAVAEIRNYINNPDEYKFSSERVNYYKLRRAFQRLNFIEERKQAERETVRQVQKEAGTVIGITITSIRKTAKINALFENVVFNNRMYNFNEGELEEIAAKIKDITGYNVLEDFYSHFDTPSHYDSGGSEKGGAFFDFVQDTSTKLKNMLTAYRDSEELSELEEQVNKFLAMARM
jgi:hypothetical protein